MTHQQIRSELGRLAKIEREMTKELLFVMCEAEKNRSYLEFGFSSLFIWLTKEFKYSNGAADRRAKAANLLMSVPEAEQNIRDGSLNLSTLTKAKSVLAAAEKAGTKVTNEIKAKALRLIENKSTDQAEDILFNAFPEAAPPVTKAKNRRMKNNITRCPMDFGKKQMANLKRIRELLSQAHSGATNTELMAFVMEMFLKQKDPLLKKSAADSPKPSKAKARRLVRQAAGDCCQFKDPLTGQSCGSRHQT